MDIRRLEAFCKVYELGSFSKAGQELYLSQPTISAHVSSLESELNVQLFDRLGRTVLPTQAGQVLYRHVREAFVSLDKARSEIQLLQDKVTGDLVIGASSIPAHYILPQALGSYIRRYPEVRVEMVVGDTQQIIDKVIAGDLLIGVVGAQTDDQELVFTPIREDDVIVIAGKDFNTRDTDFIHTKEICTWPWIMRERGSGTRKAFEKSLNDIGLDVGCLNLAVTVESTQAVLACVRAGLGLGVVSRIAAEEYLARGELKVISIPALKIKRTFSLVRHERRHLFPVTRYFISHITGDTTI